jgi:phage protein
MGRYNVHPAQVRGHYHDVKNYKERGESAEQLKEQKRLKKLRKKRGRG